MSALEKFVSELRSFYKLDAVFPKRIGHAYNEVAAELDELQSNYDSAIKAVAQLSADLQHADAELAEMRATIAAQQTAIEAAQTEKAVLLAHLKQALRGENLDGLREWIAALAALAGADGAGEP